MYRDHGYYWLRLAIYVIMAFALGTVFFRVGSTYASIQVNLCNTPNHCYFVVNLHRQMLLCLKNVSKSYNALSIVESEERK